MKRVKSLAWSLLLWDLRPQGTFVLLDELKNVLLDNCAITQRFALKTNHKSQIKIKIKIKMEWKMSWREKADEGKRQGSIASRSGQGARGKGLQALRLLRRSHEI